LKQFALLAALLTAILTYASPHVFSQEAEDTPYSGDNVSIYLGIHTINFTDVLSRGVGGGPGSITQLSPQVSRILEAIRNISMGCDTLSCITANSTARASIEQSLRELERAGYMDPEAVDEIIGILSQTSMSDYALRKLLDDPEIAQLIANISAASSPLSALGLLDSLFRGGRISLNEYIAALELLKRISLGQGLQGEALAIDRMQLEIIRQLIVSRTAEGLVRSLAGILASSEAQAQQVQPPQASRGTPLAYQPYPVYIPIPGTVFGIDLLSASIAVLAISLAAVAITGIPKRFSRLGRRARARGTGYGGYTRGYGGVLGIYWRAVEILSKRVPRRSSETHREYLGRVRSRIRSLSAFEDLTDIYERVRYAHEPEERYYERALKDYKELGGDEAS